MRTGIIRVGNELLARHGAEGLSVREIARGLGVASSAIYRHVASREELLTLLLVDAYSELADCVAGAVDAATAAADREGAWAAALAALARSMRGWALANPAKWALLYGSPVPGYAAPAQETMGPGTAVVARFLAILQEGERCAEERPELSAGLAEVLMGEVGELGLEAGPGLDPRLAADAVEAWSALVGLISAEVFEQLGAEVAAYGEEILERWIAGSVRRFGLE